MLRREPSKIEVGIEDKEEIEELRKSAATPPAGASAVLQQIDRPLSKNLPSKSQRIGIVPSSSAASSS